MHCECYFQTQSDAYIVFRVLDFEVERGQDCMYDYLQVNYVLFIVYTLDLKLLKYMGHVENNEAKV